MPFLTTALAVVGGGSAVTGAATVATVAGAATSAYSSYAQGQAEKKASRYNAAVSRNNAILVQQQSQQEAALAQNQAQWQEYNQQVLENQAQAQRNEAESLRTTTEENLKRRREDYRRILSRQRAQFAKAGVAMAGTPLEVLSESAARMELEAQDLVNQSRAAIESMYYESELTEAGAARQGADAYLTQWRGRNALTGGQYRADMLRTEADMGIARGNSLATQGYLNAKGSILSGAARTASYYN